GMAVEQLDPTPTQGEKLFYIGVAVLATIAPLTLLLVRVIGERPPLAPPKERIRFVEGLKALGRNKLMVRLLVIELVAYLPFSVTTALLYFYLTYILDAPRMQSTMGMVSFTAAIFATPAWFWISKPFDKNKVLAFSYFAVIFTSAPLAFLQPGQVWIAIALTSTAAFFHMGPQFLLRSMTADVVDTDALETGEQRTGTFFAIVEMAQKFAPTLGVAFAFPLLDVFGFDATGKHNTAQSLDALRYMYGFSPVLPLLIAGILLWRFPMDRKAHAALQEKLAARRLGAVA
ncbi:MAG: MFS transporter, partial [Phenylobacterium sp.]